MSATRLVKVACFVSICSKPAPRAIPFRALFAFSDSCALCEWPELVAFSPRKPNYSFSLVDAQRRQQRRRRSSRTTKFATTMLKSSRNSHANACMRSVCMRYARTH